MSGPQAVPDAGTRSGTVLPLGPRRGAAALPGGDPDSLLASRPDRAADRGADRAGEPAPGEAPGVVAPAPDPVAPAAPAPAEPPAATALQPAAAWLRPRHWGALVSFVVLVLLPLLGAVGYLYGRAADQYHAEAAFSVRSEEAASASVGLLGALTQIGTGSASDADILYEFIGSRQIVDAVGARLDLRAIWNRPGSGWAGGDPVFTLGDDPSNEALLAAWRRMVTVTFDQNSGLIDVEARAFTPSDAKAIVDATLEESGALMNRLAEQAREDAVRFARADLAEAEAHLRGVRAALGDFRRGHNLVDPAADVAGQSGLLAALNRELAQALVERNVLASYAPEGDQRMRQADRRIAAITAQIEAERGSLDIAGVTGSMPEVVGRYEELAVDLEFANTAYTQALAGLALARAEARRQSRYLAAHVEPALATKALYPRRALLAGLTGLFLLLGWGIVMLVYYNVRDSS